MLALSLVRAAVLALDRNYVLPRQLEVAHSLATGQLQAKRAQEDIARCSATDSVQCVGWREARKSRNPVPTGHIAWIILGP